jgi:hypothetical protein
VSPAESDSASSASITPAAGGKVLSIAYTWSVDGEPQEGVMLLARKEDGGAVKAVWTDSWHMSHDFMACEGTIDGGGKLSVLGSYAAPPGPDWRWRTEIDAKDSENVQILMFNISPDGEEMLAFRNVYERRP